MFLPSLHFFPSYVCINPFPLLFDQNTCRHVYFLLMPCCYSSYLLSPTFFHTHTRTLMHFASSLSYRTLSHYLCLTISLLYMFMFLHTNTEAVDDSGNESETGRQSGKGKEEDFKIAKPAQGMDIIMTQCHPPCLLVCI